MAVPPKALRLCTQLARDVLSAPRASHLQSGQALACGCLAQRDCSGRRGGNGFKLRGGIFILDRRKKVFTVRVVRPWQRLPREAGDDSSLATFKARLDGALTDLVWWKKSLPVAGGME